MAVAHSDAPLIRRCRQQVLAWAAAGMARCLDAARASLEEAAHSSRSVQAQLGAQDAREQLEQRRAALQASFSAALDQAIADAVDTVSGPPAGPRRSPDTLPSDMELALLDDSELSHFVESARLTQIVQPAVEHALARLDALMSSALEQPVVRPDLNPLRPEVMCRALMRALDEQSESTEVRRLWLRHLARPYARELGDLYGAVADALEQEGVQQAQYRVKFTEGAAMPVVMFGGGGPMMPAPAGGYPPGGAWVAPAAMPGVGPASQMGSAGALRPEEDLSDEDAIRRRRAPTPTASERAGAAAMAPQMVQPYDAALPQDYYAAVQRQLAQVAAAPAPAYDEAAWRDEQARMQALAVVDRPARTVTPQTPLSPRQWGEQAASPQTRECTALELKNRAGQIGQALCLDAVRALVAQLASDARLLAPVREALVALEPALLRLALAEPRFMGDGEHPARRLIETIAQRSFQYNDEFAPEFVSFFEPARQAVLALDALAEPSGQDFDQGLEALQADWRTHDEAGQQAREQSLGTLAFAQKRQQLAGKIAKDLSLRSDLAGAPGAVAQFLLGDWSLVIAHAQLTGERRELDPGGYLAIVTDLLWSVKQDQILGDPSRLFEVVPRVIATLRRGLAMLGQDPHEARALFDMLLRLHAPALKLRRLRSALDQGTAPEALTMAQQWPEAGDSGQPGASPGAPPAGQPWLSQREREAIGFIDEASDSPDQIAPTGQAALEGAIVTDGMAPPARDAKDSPGSGFAPTHPLDLERRQAGSAAAPARQEPIVTDARAQLVRLRPGDWVDLHRRREWRRAQLAWVSDNGSLYLFTSNGGQAHSMARHTLEELLCSRQVRLLEGGAVVEQALQAIAAHARREGVVTEHVKM